MKKIIAFACALLMLLSLTACGGGSEYTVGICQTGTADTLDAAAEGFRQALTDELGEDAVEFKEGDAQALVSGQVDLILANGAPALQAAAAATAEIPVVGTGVADYEAVLGTVGPNVTGTSCQIPAIDQAVMIVEWFREVESVGMLYCAGSVESRAQTEQIAKFLVDAGIACEYFAFDGQEDLASVTQAACGFADVIYVPDDTGVAAGAKTVDEVCRGAGIPVVAGEEGICADCGVAAMSVDHYDLGYAAGKMAAKLLRGEAAVADLPIEEAAGVKSLYSEARCAELGLSACYGYDPIAE